MNPKNFLFLGMAFTGKSDAAAKLARSINRDFVVIIHNMHDPTYEKYLPSKETRYIGIQSSYYSIPRNLFEATRKKYRYLWLTVYDLTPEEVKGFLDSVVEAVKYSGNMLLLIDEARSFCSPRFVSDNFIGFIRGARRYGIDFALVTHRYRDIEINIRCILNRLVLFRIVEPGDLEALRETPVGRRIDELPLLPSKFHLFVNSDQGSITGPWQA